MESVKSEVRPRPNTEYTTRKKRYRIEWQCTQAEMDAIMGLAIRKGAAKIEYLVLEDYVKLTKQKQEYANRNGA